MTTETIQLSGETTGSFVQRLDGLYAQLKSRLEKEGYETASLLCTRVYLSDAANQIDVLKSHPLYQELLGKGAFSYVEQPPLDGCKIALKAVVTHDEITKSGTPDRLIVTHGGVRHLFQSVRLTADEASRLTPRQQTIEAFDRHIAWLESEGLSLERNCIRTWLFVRDIDHNYHDIVEGRNDVFRREGLTAKTHYIASTGIGGNTAVAQAAVCIDFWSLDDANVRIQYLKALDYLNPTQQYGVAFERGTSFASEGRERLLISGTASIDREGRCLYVGDVEKQTERLFVNIEHLLSDGGAGLKDITSLTVYLRDISDYPTLNAYISKHYPGVPAVILHAPVCRPQWLVEVECIAKR